MAGLYCPNHEDVKEWVDLVAHSGLSPELMPLFDDAWAGKMSNAYALTSMHPDRDALDRAAARIFYRIIKNHSLVDGNKRSAIFCVYLFVLKNGFVLNISAGDLYDIAKSVAKSKKDQEQMISQVATLFGQHFEQLIAG